MWVLWMIQELPSCLTRLLLEVLYDIITTSSPILYSRFSLVRAFFTRTETSMALNLVLRIILKPYKNNANVCIAVIIRRFYVVSSSSAAVRKTRTVNNSLIACFFFNFEY